MVERKQAATVENTDDFSLSRAATAADELGPQAPSELDPRALVDPERRYRIGEVIGAGGMGEVRRCRDAAIGREVARKTLRGDEKRRARLERRFLREVRIQGQLEHPSIVPVHDVGVGPDGAPYFTMRRLRGRTLADVLAALIRGDAEAHLAFTRRKRLAAFVAVCLAVDYAHTRGVIHRDLKPANVMLGDFGEVYVLDWGVACVVPRPAGADAVDVPDIDPVAGDNAGTPGYMAPEQRVGAGDRHGPRTDVYALGAVLFELLALRPLHVDPRAAAADVDARPSVVVPDVPPELDEACVRATAPEPADRYPSARELAAAVERYLDGDRDLIRRRELATQHAQRGHLAARRAQDGDATEAEVEAAHAEAMRAAVQALALDADHPQAQHLFASLVMAAPRRLPAAVESELREVAGGVRLELARFVTYAMAAWAATIPVAAWLGVRDAAAFAAPSLLCVASGLLAGWIWRRRITRAWASLLLAILVAATCAALAGWLGPFILVPMAGASAAVWFATMVERRMRFAVSAVFSAAVLVPILLELAGAVAPSFTFSGDTMTLHARAVHLPPLATTLALVYTSVSFSLLQTVLLGGIRDALTAAQGTLFLQAWHLRQLARKADAAPPSAPTGPG